jgi:dihydrofolate reductase / thymidylate synthase
MASQKDMSLIFACTFDGGIGYKNNLPWHISSELKKFKEITSRTSDPKKQNAVIMGRKTWESLRTSLKGRKNIVLTKNSNYEIPDNDVDIYSTIYEAVMYCNYCDNIENIYIIGGQTIYNNILKINHFKIKEIVLSVMFLRDYRIDSYIDMDHIYSNFNIFSDDRYVDEKNKREFASYICIPKPELQQNIA